MPETYSAYDFMCMAMLYLIFRSGLAVGNSYEFARLMQGTPFPVTPLLRLPPQLRSLVSLSQLLTALQKLGISNVVHAHVVVR